MFADFVNRRGDEMEYMPGDIKSIYSKLEGGATRFALVVHCLRWACGEIDDNQLLSVDRTSMSKGIILSDWFLHEAIRNQTALTMDHQRLKASELAAWLAERSSGVTARELLKLRAGSYPDTESAKEALDRLVEEGFATVEQSKRTTKYFFCENS